MCLFAPSAVSVVLCPAVVLLLCLCGFLSVPSVLRDCQTMVLCQACGLSWNRVPGDAPCTVPTDGVLPRHCICITWPLCRRCMVAAGICIASGTGGNSLSAAPLRVSAVPGQHPLPVQHFCPIASLRWPGGAPSSGPGPAACTTAALTPPLCYFNLSL